MFTFLSSCGDDDTPEEMEEMMEEGTDQCTPYSATLAGNTFESIWIDTEDIKIFADEIVIPSDIGGGYVKVTITAYDTIFYIGMDIDGQSSFDPVYIISGTSPQITNTTVSHIREAYFSVHPDQKYSIRAYVRPYTNSFLDRYPITATVEWEFFSRIDCWEDNDSKEDAKEIHLDDINEAYAIAGHINDQIFPLDPNAQDWYKITIDTPTQLKLEIFDLPTDIRLKSYY